MSTYRPLLADASRSSTAWIDRAIDEHLGVVPSPDRYGNRAFAADADATTFKCLMEATVSHDWKAVGLIMRSTHVENRNVNTTGLRLRCRLLSMGRT